MIAYSDELCGDVAARDTLLDRVFGPARFRKSSERIRSGRLPADGLALVARDGDKLIGTVRLWHAACGRSGTPVLLLGPLAVDGDYRSEGIGAALMRLAIARAREAGHGAILLVGDEPYYRRFGFSTRNMGGLAMPGPYERSRFLGLELIPGSLAGAEGVLRPTGLPAVETAVPAAA
ncbi:GNAT family N-acetyltransferase [Oryzibacter oryziterrae]|uniref:GNAT family N-acetyltransferase n=1 Tax=Oryzibacter oryziterrae TaxID=2766474 RepID=UPI001F181000|nr:N-acetyltransferase [Oryzibacter oryziterrae]